MARELRISPPRAALLAATAAAAALAFPGIASATVTPTLAGTDLTLASDADDAITVTCAAGVVQFNGTPAGVNCADLTSLVVNGGPGANAINLAGVTTADFTHSPAPTVAVHGSGGNDTITGSDFADTLDGDEGNDSIVPGRNPGGTTDDARGGAGDDTITWNPGQGDDLNEGGDGNDTTVVNGGGGGEQFTVKPSTLAGKTVRFDRIGPSPTPGPFFIEIGTSENLLLNAGAGDDEIKGFPGLAGLIKSTFNGQDGNDEIRGTDGEDLLSGGKGFDLIRANDTSADQVECDGGIDFARVDKRDTVRACELVLGGRLRVTTAAKSLKLSGGAAALKLKCVATQRCRGVAALRRGNRTLATARFAMGKNKTQVVKLKLTAAGRRALSRVKFGSKGLRVQLRIDAKDSKGNGWRSTDNLRLK